MYKSIFDGGHYGIEYSLECIWCVTGPALTYPVLKFDDEGTLYHLLLGSDRVGCGSALVFNQTEYEDWGVGLIKLMS